MSGASFFTNWRKRLACAVNDQYSLYSDNEPKYRFGDPGKLHFISFAVVYWIDLFVGKRDNN